MRRAVAGAAAVFLAAAGPRSLSAQSAGPDGGLRLTENETFAARGAEILVYSNAYSGLFSDSKLAGVELIHSGRRTATNGDVRLSPTPEQWDPVPELVERTVDRDAGLIRVALRYPTEAFAYTLEARAQGDDLLLSVHLDAPLPAALVGRAGLNLEFLPSVYYGKTWIADGRGGVFPRHPAGPMERRGDGTVEPLPLAEGSRLVLAPEDPEQRVTVRAVDARLALYDGRDKAQNGWYVVRSLLPAGRTGKVLEWVVTAHRVPGWTRRPVIAHSQVGYQPGQRKVAVVELDPSDTVPATGRVLRIGGDGTLTEALSAPVAPWGRWMRWAYATFDFTAVTEPGLYELEVAGVRTEPFRIDADVYRRALWQPSLDTYLAVQMDHVFVNDRYRVWHGVAHADDARQAPPGHEHFDLYAQGPATDSPFQAGEHIPGLDVGGWFDAGDFDVRTQSQYAVVQTLATAAESFDLAWDETTVHEADRWVDLRRPDGVPDVVQQVAHGALALLAQHRAVGHAIPGIIVPTLAQYTHLGDAAAQTDGRVFDPTLDSLEVVGDRSGTPDDRWAFTSKSTPLDYGSAAALAAASRVLRGWDDDLAEACLRTATAVWDAEHAHEPVVFRFGNTTGGALEVEELKAAVELLVTSRGEAKYARRVDELWPFTRDSFGGVGALAVRAMPWMGDDYRGRVRDAVARYAAGLDRLEAANPFGVPITTGGWGGSGAVLAFGMQAYVLHRAFPELVGPEPTLRALDYVLGTHPASSVSMVSGVGTRSATLAYGNNRADESFIPGGVVPGVLIVRPDLPEMMDDWPFLWYESEYVIPVAAQFIYLANAAADLLR